MEEIEQIVRELLVHDEEAYQLHHTEALGWFERVLKKTDIKQDRIKFAAQKEDMGHYHGYTAFLVVMPDPATLNSTGLLLVSLMLNLNRYSASAQNSPV